MDELFAAIKKAKNSQSSPFATFDFDNTCIEHDVAEAVLSYVCKNKLLKDRSLVSGEGDPHELVFRHYYNLLQSSMVDAYMFCAETLSGFSENEIDDLVSATIEAEGNAIGSVELYGVTVAKGLVVRPKIKEILAFVKSENIAVWIVSASPELIIKAAMKRFDIEGQLVGLRNVIRDGMVTRDLQKPYSIGDGKVECIKKYIGEAKPIVAAGDSMNDFPMLEYSSVRVVVDRDNALADEARTRGWFLV